MARWLLCVCALVLTSVDAHQQKNSETSTSIESGGLASADNAISTSDNPLGLSRAETQFLRNKKQITYCIDPNWMPYERISSQGQHEGLSADYVKRLSVLLKIPLQLVPTASWKQSLRYARERRCDFLPLATAIEERRAYLSFLPPYVSYPSVIATTSDKLFIENMSDVLDKTFAITQGYAAISKLKALYPGIKLREVKGVYEGLELVRQHKVFGFIDSTLTIGHAIAQQGLLDIKISGKSGIEVTPSVAIRNDEPLLASAIAKAMSHIDADQRRAIYNKWVSIRYETPVNYTLIGLIVMGCLALVIAISFWNRKLAQANTRAQKALTQLNQLKLTLEQQNQELERKNQQLNNFAHTDALTGLNNRAKLDVVLESEIKRCQRYGAPMGLVMLDIDHFKRVNDTYGHQVGDRVLMEIADLMQAHTREVDIIGRWGGEEFMLICPQTQLEDVISLSEKLRRIVSEYPFEGINRQTISLGVAQLQPQDTSPSLIQRADQALYSAKANGRNRVESKGSESDPLGRL